MTRLLTSLCNKLTSTQLCELQPVLKTHTRIQRVFSFGAVRILLAFIFIAPFIAAGNLISIFVLDRFTGNTNLILEAIRAILIVVFVLIAYCYYCRKIEHREAKEISLKYSLQEWGWGFILSLVMLSVIVGILYAGGMYHIKEISVIRVLYRACYVFIAGAFLQEMIFRVILFNIIEDFIGSWKAIIAIAIIFAMVHLGNANSNYISAISQFLSDFLLSAVFILTRRIWMVWGVHAGWNFIQDGILGMPNSGIDSFPSLIKPIVTGPGWLTGGKFGIESSLSSVILNVAFAILILNVAYNYKRIVLPKWIKGREI